MAPENDIITEALRQIQPVEKRLIHNPELPHQFLPASTAVFQELFYWDSYFTLLGVPERQDIILNTIENMFHLLEKLGHVPNSFPTNPIRSQPPFLSSMVRLVKEPGEEFLKRAYKMLTLEYTNVWTSERHMTSCGLSKYHSEMTEYDQQWAPQWGADYSATQESGWDMTTRFQHRAHIVAPIDLNSLLYRYEVDIANIAKALDNVKQHSEWLQRSEERKEKITQFMWNPHESFFFDYDPITNERLDSKTLAGFFPLWAGFATREQALGVKKNLSVFERIHGLSCTEERLGRKDCQWGYPNGWAALHWIAIQGLHNYGFSDDAERITKKWLTLCAQCRLKHNEWFEKCSVVPEAERMDDARYPHRGDFGWTIGVFQALYRQTSKNSG